MDIKVNAIDLITILTEIQNLFHDLTPTAFQKFLTGETEDERILIRQRVLKARVIELLEKGLEANLDLYKGTTPFSWDSKKICEALQITPNRRQKK